ncbi:MAG: hypothetical protein ACI94Y_004269, partial [Maribacter sp.]
ATMGHHSSINALIPSMFSFPVVIYDNEIQDQI